MPGLIDEVGHKHNRLSVINRAGNNSSGHATWTCTCDCGNVVIVDGPKLRNGHTKSCGCIRFHLPDGVAAFNQLYDTMIRNAKKREYEWKLSKEEVYLLTQQPCYYCGSQPQNVKQAKYSRLRGDYLYNGLDRVDNGRGYSSDNIVTCCKRCNNAKRAMTQREFKEWVRAVAILWALT